MSHTTSKKSVFERIGASGGSSSSSNTNTGTMNTSNKSTHGFCNSYIKTGTCPLGETCKYIHEQPNVDKQSGSKDEFRITKTINRVVDVNPLPIKSTVTISNEQRSISSSNSMQSTRTVVESVNTTSTDHSDRRSSGSDRKQSQSRSSDSKTKSSPKKKTHSSSHESRHSSNKKTRSMESDSPVSSASESEYTHSSHKHKRKSDNHSTSSKHKKYESLSPNRNNNDEEETLNDQINRQTYNKSPKRTIVITERKKDENPKQPTKDSKTKSNPDIEFLGSKKIIRDKKATETIHQQAENTKKSLEIKREKKSPTKSSSDQPRRHSSSTSSSINEKTIQIKIEDTKTQSNKNDKSVSSTPPIIVQLSPTPELLDKDSSVTLPNEPEKTTPVQPPSPICVILDDDSSPSPATEKKLIQQISGKKVNENEKTDSKQNKRSRDSDKNHNKDKTNEHTETKRKRLNDGSSRKTSSSSKNRNDNRSTTNRSDVRRNENISSRDEPSSSRKYKEKSESKSDRNNNNNNNSKDRNSSAPSSSSKSRNTKDRHDTTRSSPDKKRSTHRKGKEKGLENVTDSEEHLEEPILPKQTAYEAYMLMDWSSLSRDKRIPLNTQITSRITHIDNNNINSIGICERLLTNEQKQKLNQIDSQAFPLTHFLKQLQIKSTTQIVNSCNRRFASCAKDMIDMRHKWFTKSIEPVEQYEFINKEHYLAYQQAINSLLDKTSNDIPTVQIETTTADILLS